MNTLHRTEEWVAQHQAKHGRGRPLPLSREKEPQSGTLSFTLPVAPTVNNAYVTVNHRVTGRALLVMSKAGKDFKKHASEEAQKHALAQRWKYPEGARIALTLRLVMPQKNADISNRVKIAEDAIAAGLGFNDSCVWLLVVERLGIDKANPRCEVTVNILEQNSGV